MADKRKKKGTPEEKKALFFDISREREAELHEMSAKYDAEIQAEAEAYMKEHPFTDEEREIMAQGNTPHTFAMLDALEALRREFSNIQKNLSAIAQFNEEHPEVLDNFLSMRDAEWNLMPFIGLAISDEAKHNPSLLDAEPLAILREGIDDEGRPTESQYKAVIEKAIALQHAFFESDTNIADLATITQALDPDITPETEKKLRELIARIAPQWEEREAAQIIKARIKSRPHVDYPVDKLSSKAWSFFPAALKKHDGQYQYLRVNTSKKGTDAGAIIQFSAKENGITLSRDLSAAHEWLHNVFANLCLEGNEVFSLTHLYSEMGNKDRPNKQDLERLLQKLEEMRHIDITIDNAQEVEDAKYNYPHFTYRGSLLPFEIITAEINGQVVEGAIHPLRTPPMMQFAKERKQISEVPKDVLRFDLPKTEANLSLAGYLIKTICRMKNDTSDTNHKLKLDTIYENCNMNTRAKRNQRMNAPKKIARLLNYWQSIGWIKGYHFDNEFIVFDIDTSKKIGGKRG